jgi:hypothetical protein
VKATAIMPQVLKSANETYNVNTDPPLIMNLWNTEMVVTKPYFVPFMSVGTILIVSGAVSSVWAGGYRRKQGRHLKKTSRAISKMARY